MSESTTPGDLPDGLGRPATRALAASGVTTLAGAGEWSERELLALHGVGPKAIRLLREAMNEQGLRFREPQ